MCKASNTNSKISIEVNDRSARVSFDIPVVASENTPENWENLAIDILGSFSTRIIESLRRRIAACEAKLVHHLDTAYTTEYGQRILYKNGKVQESFNYPNYQGMKDCIKALEFSSFRAVLDNRPWIDQILKALLNDPEQNHEDAGGFKYSQLVSLLCEVHMFPKQDC